MTKAAVGLGEQAAGQVYVRMRRDIGIQTAMQKERSIGRKRDVERNSEAYVDMQQNDRHIGRQSEIHRQAA